MNARRAARELALLAFSQLTKKAQSYEKKDLEEIILLSVRTLAHDAESSLKLALSGLFQIKQYIQDYEIEHPNNEARPIEARILPVPLPLTSDMEGRVDSVIDASDKALVALEMAEISALARTAEVKEFTFSLINSYRENSENIDAQISKNAQGWSLDRLVRIDRDILRIAITELLYFEAMPISVSIDEAVELAKRFSTEESSSFINGILRQVVEDNDLQQLKRA